MIQIPLYIALIIYLVLLSVLIAFIAINFYHIIISGSFTMTSFFVTFLTVILTVLTLYFTAIQLLDTNWAQPITIFSSGWIGTTPSPF